MVNFNFVDKVFSFNSLENQSSKSRHAYSLHVVDTEGCKWAQENWFVHESLVAVFTFLLVFGILGLNSLFEILTAVFIIILSGLEEKLIRNHFMFLDYI